MRDIVLLEQFTKLANESDGDQEIYRAKASDTEVLFEVKPEAFSLIADYKPDFEIRGSDSIRVTIPIGQIENLGRIVGRYSGKVRVLAPEHARQAVREFALAALGELPKSDEAE
jgi:proteasome accessory factor C